MKPAVGGMPISDRRQIVMPIAIAGCFCAIPAHWCTSVASFLLALKNAAHAKVPSVATA